MNDSRATSPFPNRPARKALWDIFGASPSKESAAADECALSSGSEYMGAGVLTGSAGNRADGLEERFATKTSPSLRRAPHGLVRFAHVGQARRRSRTVGYSQPRKRADFRGKRARRLDTAGGSLTDDVCREFNGRETGGRGTGRCAI